MRTPATSRNHPIRAGYGLLSFLLIVSGLSVMSVHAAQGQSFDSVMHIHSVKAIGNRVLIGTHNGLFEFQAQNSMKPVGAERFDTMGLTVSGSTIFASGHPAKGSKLPEPLGLLRSDDSGKSWKKVSLQGTVDFHLLEAGKSELYGADAQTGVLMYSANSGKNWKNIGQNRFSDIAITNQKLGHAYAVEKGRLVMSTDSFATQSVIKTGFQVSSTESVGKIVYATSGKVIYKSSDQGKNWKKLNAFKLAVSDISVSDQIFVAIVGNEVLISKDKGKSFNS